MSIRVATFNTENLFRRPRAINDETPSAAQATLEAFATLSNLIARDPYTEADRAGIVEILQKYDVTDAASNTRPFLVNQTRDSLYTVRRGGDIEVTARGRGDWVGWIELIRDSIAWEATENTARVIDSVDADVLLTVEVEDRQTLQRFTDQVLSRHMAVRKRYPYNLLVDGNDTRGIDVGLLSRRPIASVRSHFADRKGGNQVFSRDCPEFEVELPGGETLWILGNHFKSKGYGKPTDTADRRRIQAGRVAEIYTEARKRSPYVVVAGDLNDSPDSEPLRILGKTGLRDVMTHDSYAGTPGTYQSGKSTNQKIDYLLLSPELWERLTSVGVERRGVWAPRSFQSFPSVTSRVTQSSDHAALYADLDL